MFSDNSVGARYLPVEIKRKDGGKLACKNYSALGVFFYTTAQDILSVLRGLPIWISRFCDRLGNLVTIEFSLINGFTESDEFSDKNICHYSKRARTYHLNTSCVRDQDVTTVPARHM